MKVLIMGAETQGLVISWVLAKADDVSEFVLGDISHILEACYEAKGNYLDMASNGNFPDGDKNIPVKELAYSGKWKQASLKGLILAGADASTLNVIA